MFLETAPVLVAVPLLIFTYRRFTWTPLAYRLASETPDADSFRVS